MVAFNDFVHKCKLKNIAKSNINVYQVFPSLSLNNVSIYSRDGPFSSDIGIVNLHPSKGTHWVVYVKENYFDIYGCVCPKKPSEFSIK